MRISFVGVYPVDAPEPCHLIELLISDCVGVIDVRDFTQEVPGQSQDYWQAPWDERVLDATGQHDLLGRFPQQINAHGEVRIAFFFHHLDFTRPLATPAGPVSVPAPSDRPDRLKFLLYEEPC